MSRMVKSVFAEATNHLTIDKTLLKRIRSYAIYFVNKNPDHIAFFGGNLLGVQVIRFKVEDKDKWFDDILDVDEYFLRDELHSLDKINPEFKVSSDAFYLSCAALANSIYNSPVLSAAEKEAGMIDVFMIMQYKMITSIMYNFFPYPADPGVAAATYAALSMKFSLKVYGTWNKLLEARAKDIIAHNSIHYNTITKMDDDEAVIYLLSDIQTRLRNIVKVMRGVFETIRQTKGKFVVTNAIGLDMEGNSFVKDKARSYSMYRRYLHEMIADKSSFIKLELVEIIGKAIHTMPEKMLMDTLEYMVEHYRYRGEHIIEEIIDDTLLHTFDYISSNKNLNIHPNDLAGMISKLKAVFMSSRSTDPMLLKIRKNLESVVSKSIRSKNPSIIASVRTGVMLYLILRAFTMRHYSK